MKRMVNTLKEKKKGRECRKQIEKDKMYKPFSVRYCMVIRDEKKWFNKSDSGKKKATVNTGPCKNLKSSIYNTDTYFLSLGHAGC